MSRALEYFREYHAPTQELSLPEFQKQGVRLFIKREDLIHHYISGNKWRKLKFNLAEAERLEAREIVTFGGAYSNHLVATACAAASLGFTSVGIVRGGERLDNPIMNLCQTFGMRLFPVSRELYKDKQQCLGLLPPEERRLVLPEGGSNHLAVNGSAEIIRDLPHPFDYIFCPVGTGGTLAGLSRGASRLFPGCSVEGIAVLKLNEGFESEIRLLAGEAANWKLHYQFARGGYAKADAALYEFIKFFAAQTGILLDQVYTGKMMMAVFDLMRAGYFRRGAKIVVIHTGGLPGYNAGIQ